MSAVLSIPAGVGVTHLPRPFVLDQGGQLDDAHIAFDIEGPASAPVVIVAGGISSGRRVSGADGFWPQLVGPGCAIDTTQRRVLSIDFLGASGASSGAQGLPITPADQAAALRAVLDEIGVGQVVGFVGASYGGQVGLAFAAQAAERLGGPLVVLCAAHESHPLATGWRAIQRSIVEFGCEVGAPERGMAIARALAMTTYRSAGEFAERFDNQQSPATQRFPVQEYLEARGAAFAAEFDTEAFASLSLSLDLHSVDPAAIRAATTVVGFDTDVLVPPWQLRGLVDALVHCDARYVEVATRFGHDGFLKEHAALAPILREVL